jgi:hypothetical protein
VPQTSSVTSPTTPRFASHCEPLPPAIAPVKAANALTTGVPER